MVIVVSLPGVDGDEMEPWLWIDEAVACRIFIGGLNSDSQCLDRLWSFGMMVRVVMVMEGKI